MPSHHFLGWKFIVDILEPIGISNDWTMHHGDAFVGGMMIKAFVFVQLCTFCCLFPSWLGHSCDSGKYGLRSGILYPCWSGADVGNCCSVHGMLNAVQVLHPMESSSP